MALTTALPETFSRAVTALRRIRCRDEIRLDEVAPPTKLAPYAFALGATVLRRGTEVTAGRLIFLHNPAGHASWQGTTRLVTLVTAALDREMATDPLLPQVGWSWLVDALDTHTEGYAAVGGTVTQTISSRFGALDPEGELQTTTDLELRASWTPMGRTEAHADAWCALLASTAGLPPVGVSVLPLHH